MPPLRFAELLGRASQCRALRALRNGAPAPTLDRLESGLVPRIAVEDAAVAGPAIIESYDTTIVVPPGCTAHATGSGCIAIEMGEADA